MEGLKSEEVGMELYEPVAPQNGLLSDSIFFRLLEEEHAYMVGRENQI